MGCLGLLAVLAGLSPGALDLKSTSAATLGSLNRCNAAYFTGMALLTAVSLGCELNEIPLEMVWPPQRTLPAFCAVYLASHR